MSSTDAKGIVFGIVIGAFFISMGIGFSYLMQILPENFEMTRDILDILSKASIITGAIILITTMFFALIEVFLRIAVAGATYRPRIGIPEL